MHKTLVKDIMLPLSEYAVVDEDATLLDAINALEKAQGTLPPGKQPHRAVLVRGKKSGKIIGKMGHLSFIKALEPKYNSVSDIDRLARVGVSAETINMMMENYRFWQDDREMICRRAQNIPVKKAMKDIEDSVDENQPLTEAMHHMIMSHTLSLLVTRKSEVVGILRLSDLFDTVASYIKSAECKEE